jgi:hypothetical protein
MAVTDFLGWAATGGVGYPKTSSRDWTPCSLTALPGSANVFLGEVRRKTLAIAPGTEGEVVLEISADNTPGNCGPPPPSGLLIDDVQVE